MTNSHRIFKNGSVTRGFIKMSVSLFLLSTCSKTTSPFSTWSHRKLWHISMCLVQECNTWFLVRLIALVLSYIIIICWSLLSKSSSCCLRHKIWAQQLPTVMYFVFAVDKTTMTSFYLCQLTKEFMKRATTCLVTFTNEPASTHLVK